MKLSGSHVNQRFLLFLQHWYKFHPLAKTWAFIWDDPSSKMRNHLKLNLNLENASWRWWKLENISFIVHDFATENKRKKTLIGFFWSKVSIHKVGYRKAKFMKIFILPIRDRARKRNYIPSLGQGIRIGHRHLDK